MSPKPNPLTRGKKQKALVLLQHNQTAGAKPLLEHVCRIDPRDTEAWLLLGTVCQNMGSLMEADGAYRQALALRPDFLEAWCNLGSVLELRRCPVEALDCYRRALQINPDMPELWYNTGNVLQALGRHEEAEQSYREAVQLQPTYAEAHDHLGVVAAKQGKHAEAVAHYRRALAIRPDHATSHCNLAMSLKHLDQLDEAVASYRRALVINPHDTDVHVNLGVVLTKQKKFDEAVAHYRETLRLRPNDADAYNNLGMAFVEQKRFDEAVTYYSEALRLRSDYADAHFNLSLLFLLRGDFRSGWSEYRWRWQREGKPPRSFPPSPWEGEDLLGKDVFLHTEQGLGDELFFLRFVPWLKQRGAGKITYLPTPKIASLLSRAKPVNKIAGPDETPGTDDFVFSIGDLPWLLGMERVDQIPPPLSLMPLPEKIEQIQARLASLGPPPYLGVTWRAGVKNVTRGLYKEIPLEDFAQTLCETPGTILALQRLPGKGEVDAFSRQLQKPVHDLTALNDDLEEMFALLSCIDEYIGVSNTNMHLRAAAGRTAHVLVSSPPEWRWMAEGLVSPWFPGFTLYRQQSCGDWRPALAALRQGLIGF